MKNNILHIVFTLVFLVSCISERSEKDEDMAGGTRGMMSIEVLVDGADEHDYVHTARFITFDDASVFPVIDINEVVAFARLTNSFRVLLENTYTGGYLVAGTEADGTRFQTGADVENNFGRMLIPVSDYEYVGWIYKGSDSLELDDTKQLICAFYTPERTCSAPGDVDKLVLDIIGLSTPDGLRDTRTILSEFSPEGGGNVQALTEIRRNSVYRIVGVVKEKTVQFEHTVIPWSDAGQGIIIDPQYFLRVSRDNLYISNDGKSVIITTETNYDRTDRGFPKGIQLGMVSYYDKNGDLLAPSHVQSDWLQVAMSEVAGSLLQKLTFTVSGNLSSVDIGCYAVVEIKAGNLTKEVRVTRS